MPGLNQDLDHHQCPLCSWPLAQISDPDVLYDYCFNCHWLEPIVWLAPEYQQLHAVSQPPPEFIPQPEPVQARMRSAMAVVRPRKVA